MELNTQIKLAEEQSTRANSEQHSSSELNVASLVGTKFEPKISVSPDLHYQPFSFRDNCMNISGAECSQIEEILAEIPRDLPMTNEALANFIDPHSPDLTSEGKQALEGFVAYYTGYRHSFPDVSEVEPPATVWSYLYDNPTWDFQVIIDDNGRALAACSGQVLEGSDGNNVVWTEHTWVASENRSNGLGTKIFSAFESYMSKEHGASLVVIEVDNPYAIVSELECDDPRSVDLRAFDSTHPERRLAFWTDTEVDGGMEMATDPFLRFAFWEKQGFQMLTYSHSSSRPSAAPYAQISLDPDNDVPPCETIFIAAKGVGQSLETLGTVRYLETYELMQSSISDDFGEQAVYSSTKAAIEDLGGSLQLTKITGAIGQGALLESAMAKQAK
jgi:hypothetical protein